MPLIPLLSFSSKIDIAEEFGRYDFTCEQHIARGLHESDVSVSGRFDHINVDPNRVPVLHSTCVGCEMHMLSTHAAQTPCTNAPPIFQRSTVNANFASWFEFCNVCCFEHGPIINLNLVGVSLECSDMSSVVV